MRPLFFRREPVRADKVVLCRLIAIPIATLDTNAVLPFLNMREMDLQVRVSEVAYEETVTSFRTKMVKALIEVANGLSSRSALSLQHQHLKKALNARKRAEALYETRYRAGAIALRPLLDAHAKSQRPSGGTEEVTI